MQSWLRAPTSLAKVNVRNTDLDITLSLAILSTILWGLSAAYNFTKLQFSYLVNGNNIKYHRSSFSMINEILYEKNSNLFR